MRFWCSELVEVFEVEDVDVDAEVGGFVGDGAFGLSTDAGG